MKQLLSKYDTVYITPTLLAQLKTSGQEAGFLDVLKAAGARKIVKKAPLKSGRAETRLVFGGEREKE